MKTLYRGDVIKYGWDTVESVTKEMLLEYSSIGPGAFYGNINLKEVYIPDNIISVQDEAFRDCSHLEKVTIRKCSWIGDYAFCNSCLDELQINESPQTIGRDAFYVGKLLGCSASPEEEIIAYKGFDINMRCLGFQYEEGKTYYNQYPVMCKSGFHACLNPLDVFNYYFGGSNEVIFRKVRLRKVVYGKGICDSKVVAGEITIGAKITVCEMAKIYTDICKMIQEHKNENVF